MDAAAELARNPVSKHQIQPEYGGMNRLTRNGTAEPVSRDQILRHAPGQGNIIFPCSADHEQDWQPYPVDPYPAICDDHTYIHIIHTKVFHINFSFFFFNLTYSRWTSSLPSCLWSQRIFPSLPGSRLIIFYRDASSALLQLVNQWLNFTYSRSHAFRYDERKNTNPPLVRIELTTSALAGVQVTYYDL